MRYCANNIFDILNPRGIKVLTRLRLGLSHPDEHRFRHCFQDTLDHLCGCSKDIKSTMHFFSWKLGILMIYFISKWNATSSNSSVWQSNIYRLAIDSNQPLNT